MEVVTVVVVIAAFALVIGAVRPKGRQTFSRREPMVAPRSTPTPAPGSAPITTREIREVEAPRSTPKPAPTATPIPPQEIREVQASRFDPSSAKHLSEERFLTGTAYVIDGDTIRIQKTQVRLFGIDAPELDHPYGKQAKWALHALCKGHVIRAEITDIDGHGRTLAHCYLPDGRDLSAEMVKQGMAIDWPKFSGGRYKSLETPGARKKLFLADARQKGRMQVWENFEKRKNKQ